jgi:NADH-quinone oxidoreductase subunit C
MSAITNEFLLEKLKGEFGDKILSAELPYGLLTIVIDPAAIVDMLKWLYEDKIFKFQFLTDICGSHYPDLKDQELCVIYHVHSLENNIRLRIKAFLPITHPEIQTATSIYHSANWMERETYDFYGILFKGHPNLKRILNVDEMDYFPLRKEYPLEDGTRTDKEDQYFGR